MRFNAGCFNSAPFNANTEPRNDASNILPQTSAELAQWAGRHPRRSDLATFVLFKLVGSRMPPKLEYIFKNWVDRTPKPRGRPKASPFVGNIILERYPICLKEQRARWKALTPAQKRAIPRAERKPPNLLAASASSRRIAMPGMAYNHRSPCSENIFVGKKEFDFFEMNCAEERDR
jgi:hypothetical protein